MASEIPGRTFRYRATRDVLVPEVSGLPICSPNASGEMLRYRTLTLLLNSRFVKRTDSLCSENVDTVEADQLPGSVAFFVHFYDLPRSPERHE